MTVLIVEDNDAIRLIIEELLLMVAGCKGIRIWAADSALDALNILKTETITLLITDLNLGTGPDGFYIIRQAHTLPEQPYIVAMSSICELASTNQFLENGQISYFLAKPFKLSDLQVMMSAYESFCQKKHVELVGEDY